MKYFSVRIVLALITFAIGISLTALWLFNKEVPDVSIPQSEIIRASNFSYDSELPLSERKFWEKEIFSRFKEKPLIKYSSEFDETYRLILLPTFHKPLIIRLSRKGNERFLTTKKLSGEGGFGIKKFGKLAFEKTQPLSETEWTTFVNLLEKAYFLDLPTIDKNEEPVNDGAEWVIEGLQNGKFHDIHRITPNEDLEAYYIYLLKLSGVDKEYEGYLDGKYSS
jgi:hypothetical protein